MKGGIRKSSVAFGRGLHDLHYRSETESKTAPRVVSVISPNSTLLNSTESSSRCHSIRLESKNSSPRSIISDIGRAKGPNFQKINVAKIKIKSLRNKINRPEYAGNITDLMMEVIELEKEILFEKTKGYTLLEAKKKMIQQKMESLARELMKLEDELSIVDLELKQKIEKAREQLTEKIKVLETEYETVARHLDRISQHGP